MKPVFQDRTSPNFVRGSAPTSKSSTIAQKSPFSLRRSSDSLGSTSWPGSCLDGTLCRGVVLRSLSSRVPRTENQDDTCNAMRIALITNFIPPYRVPLFKQLRSHVDELRIFAVGSAPAPNFGSSRSAPPLRRTIWCSPPPGKNGPEGSWPRGRAGATLARGAPQLRPPASRRRRRDPP